MKRKRMLALVTMFALVLGFLAADGNRVQATESKDAEAPFSGVVWIAGDSIAADHSDNADKGDPRPLVGWGEVLGEYANITVHNEARSGRSTKSYVSENNNYKTIMKEIGAGDIFFIQFGHNDENESSKLHTDPAGASTEEGSYKWYLATKFIDPALEAGAYPVLCTSVVRYLVKDGKLEEQSHAPYVEAMKELAAEYEAKGITIPVIDCHAYTKQLYMEDIEGSESYHALVKDESSGEEQLDTTHYCEKGARMLAQYILKECPNVLPESVFSEHSLAVITKGDADGDGKVTIQDVIAVMKHVLGVKQENFSTEAADCDGKEGITVEDAEAILAGELEHYVGKCVVVEP